MASTPPPLARTVIPDGLPGSGLAALLQPRLPGAAIGGAAAVPAGPRAAPPAAVVWVDGGDEVLVHLDSLATQVVGGTALVAIDLETDQAGRGTLVVAFAIDTSGGSGLVAATDPLPRGNGLLVARWGAAVRDAAWAALLAVIDDHATQQGIAPRGISIAGGQLLINPAAAP